MIQYSTYLWRSKPVGARRPNSFPGSISGKLSFLHIFIYIHTCICMHWINVKKLWETCFPSIDSQATLLLSLGSWRCCLLSIVCSSSQSNELFIITYHYVGQQLVNPRRRQVSNKVIFKYSFCIDTLPLGLGPWNSLLFIHSDTLLNSLMH